MKIFIEKHQKLNQKEIIIEAKKTKTELNKRKLLTNLALKISAHYYIKEVILWH
jgi:hypothetical protein